MTDLPDNANTLITDVLRLEDWIDAENKRFGEHLKPVKARVEELRNKLFELLSKQGGESIKTDAGTAYKSTIVTPSIEDREKYLDFVLDEANWEAHGNALMQLGAPNKATLKEYQDTHEGQLPPGVKTSSFTRVNVRRS